MKTLLGAKYLALEPGGAGQLKEDSEIPLERTVSSYDIVNAFTDLATTSERIDTDQLAKSLTVLATEFKDSPPDVKAALDGLSRLSEHDRLARRRAAATCWRRPTASAARSRSATRRSSRSSRTPTC